MCGRNELGLCYYVGISTGISVHFLLCQYIHTSTRILKPFEESQPTGLKMDIAWSSLQHLSERISIEAELGMGFAGHSLHLAASEMKASRARLGSARLGSGELVHSFVRSLDLLITSCPRRGTGRDRDPRRCLGSGDSSVVRASDS